MIVTGQEERKECVVVTVVETAGVMLVIIELVFKGQFVTVVMDGMQIVGVF